MASHICYGWWTKQGQDHQEDEADASHDNRVHGLGFEVNSHLLVLDS